jgi:uncharacterized protein (DUF983 family)
MSPGSFLHALGRGARRLCPECGEGRLFRGYLKVQPVCEACGHENGRYPSDDAPPYFTILIVGHLVVAPMLLFPFIWQAPAWLVLVVTLPVLAGLTLLILPIVKGAVIGGHWAVGHRHPEDEAVAAPPPGAY